MDRQGRGSILREIEVELEEVITQLEAAEKNMQHQASAVGMLTMRRSQLERDYALAVMGLDPSMPDDPRATYSEADEVPEHFDQRPPNWEHH